MVLWKQHCTVKQSKENMSKWYPRLFSLWRTFLINHFICSVMILFKPTKKPDVYSSSDDISVIRIIFSSPNWHAMKYWSLSGRGQSQPKSNNYLFQRIRIQKQNDGTSRAKQYCLTYGGGTCFGHGLLEGHCWGCSLARSDWLCSV